jgi:hypothetical protein
MRSGPLLALGMLFGVLASGCAAVTPSASTSTIVEQVPLVDGERYVYELTTLEGEVIGSGELSTRFEGTRFVLEQRFEGVPTDGLAAPTDVTELAVDMTSFAPFGALREATIEGDDGSPKRDLYNWSYAAGDKDDGDELTVIRTSDGDQDTDQMRLRDNYYDNESSLWLWRTIDFNEELDVNYVSVNPIQQTQQTVNIQTPAIETVEVPAGTFEAWRLIVRNGRAIRSAWINAAPPHQILQWDNGDVIFRLTEFEVPEPSGG